MALQRTLSDDTVIFLTRAGTFFGLDVPVPSFAYRIDQTVDGDQFKPVADLFTATRGWWRAALPDIPDLVLNEDHQWSQCLWALFKQRGAVDATGVCTIKETK